MTQASSDLQLGATAANLTPLSATDEAAKIRERCRSLGISWVEKPPETDPAAIQLLTPEVAVRVRSVPIRIERGRLILGI